MANIASLLKEEIVRLARKEIRAETAGLKKASAQYRSEIAALKRRVATQEQQLSRLGKKAAKRDEASAEPDAETKVRFVAKGFKTLRQRLGLSANDMGKLLEVSAQSIYNWEAENSSPRKQQLAKIAMLRGMGKREVAAMLEKLPG
jgi:DNA-binding transcriptional regulator YiaG